MSAREYTYVPSPWFRFANCLDQFARSHSQSRHIAWCQPDGLDIDIKRGLITVVEFKLQHTSAAWWQTRRLYEPVVRRVFGGLWDFAIVEIVKWYDPDVAFPERFSFISSLADAAPGRFHVLVWNGRGRGGV